jgi:hypothetical protein
MDENILKIARQIKKVYDSGDDAEEVITLGTQLAINVLIEAGELSESERF